jgi:hypothetical protein
MLRAGFELTIPVFEWPKSVPALDHAATGAGCDSAGLRAGLSGFYGSIPGGGWEIFSSPPRPERLWGPSSLLSV